MENVHANYRPSSFDEKTSLLNELDKKIMSTTEKSLIKQKLLQIRSREIKSNIDALLDKKAKLVRGVNVAFPLMRRKMKEMADHHQEKMELQKKKTSPMVLSLSQRLEKQIRYRRYAWTFNKPEIFDQIEAFLDLLAYTHQNLPVKDVDPWGTIERSIAYDYKRLQRIRIQLKTLNIDYTAKIKDFQCKMNEIEKRLEILKKKDIKMHERYQYYLNQFAQEDDDMIESIENKFRILLQERNRKARQVQFRASDRFIEAKKSCSQLQNAREVYLYEKCPLEAMKKQFHIISENKSIKMAKLRVDKIILSHLQSENFELKERIQKLNEILDSKSSSTSPYLENLTNDSV